MRAGQPSLPRRMVVVGDTAVAGSLARSLAGSPAAARRAEPERAEHRSILLPPSGLRSSFAAAVGELGGVDVVVCAHFDPAVLVSRPLVETAAADWSHGIGRTLDIVRELTVLASVPLHESGGQLVFVVPTIAMTGAPGWVPLATAAEGIRSWAKSVARQWAPAPVAVNCVATALPVILGDGSADPVPSYIGVGFTEGDPPGTDDLRAAIDALGGPLASRVSGATITVDGGVHVEP